MKNKYRILKIIVTVVVLGFLLSFSLKRFSETKMPGVALNMMQGEHPVYFIDEQDIQQMIAQYNPSQKIGSIDIPRLEKQIRSLPAIDSANVYLSLNGILHLDIIQRTPIFRLQNGKQEVYIDAKGVAFPMQKNYAYPCMLVSGNISKEEYLPLIQLVNKINRDEFCRKFFIGIVKKGQNYHLITNEEHYTVELGSLENIDFKIQGFKTFVEKYLVYQEPQKYSKISLKYNNQIVTTLSRPYKTQQEDKK
ncbi:cell division protein FtsQ/DivIB [Riemerella columbina]|uniref:cell division protein FtsQ/DivIB n=1 Tax=Riemerella columbina TaxID=103810 RepID=UPI0026707F38|nr:cell division protein FtsQ [Riemerella columbina]WKS95379.1 cell division protein FtsQ [Riemerella columbina]